MLVLLGEDFEVREIWESGWNPAISGMGAWMMNGTIHFHRI